MSGGIKDYWEAIKNLPKTQKDISTLAKTAKQVQSPAVQQQVKELKSDVEDLGMTILVLQAVGTFAMVGMFFLAAKRSKRS
jgi:hypothetical protein